MRKIFALLLVCLAAMASLTAMAINTSDYVIEEGIPVGDVNGDGTVTAADITALYDVLLNNNYSNVVYGDQTSQTAAYTSYPSEYLPIRFDIKNGYIGMVLDTGTNSARKVMASTLNSYNDGKVMENSAASTIYDVWLQTSLDN